MEDPDMKRSLSGDDLDKVSGGDGLYGAESATDTNRESYGKCPDCGNLVEKVTVTAETFNGPWTDVYYECVMCGRLPGPEVVVH